MRKELTESVPEGQAYEALTDLVATWDKGDAVDRRVLLAQLFTDIHIHPGRVHVRLRAALKGGGGYKPQLSQLGQDQMLS